MPKTSILNMVAALSRATADKGALKAATANTSIDWTMLAAIGLRETSFQNIAQVGGGMGRGVFQIDIGKNPSVTEAQAFDPIFAASWAANLLSTNMNTLAGKFSDLTPDQLLQATAASYNFGTKNISGHPDTIDAGTTGNNYGSNVVSLMDCFRYR
jgi:hypothetical protein